MATEDKQRILDWCGADSDVRYVQEGADPGADFSLVLESAGTELTATLPSGSDRIVLRNVVDLAQAAQPAGSGDLAADLTDLEERRPGPVTVVLEPTGEAVAVSTWVVSDGLTKHSFLTAVSDVIRTRGAVLRLAGLPADLPAAEAAGTVAAPEEHEAPRGRPLRRLDRGRPRDGRHLRAGADVGAVALGLDTPRPHAPSTAPPRTWRRRRPTPRRRMLPPDLRPRRRRRRRSPRPSPPSRPRSRSRRPRRPAPRSRCRRSAPGERRHPRREPSRSPSPPPPPSPPRSRRSAFGSWGTPQVTPALEEPVAETPAAGVEEQVPAYSSVGLAGADARAARGGGRAGARGHPARASSTRRRRPARGRRRRRSPKRRPRRPPRPATEKQPAAVSPWASPTTPSFETVTSPSQGYQPEATPSRLRGHPEPGRPAGRVFRRRLRTGLRPAVHAGDGGGPRAGARSRPARLDPQPSGPAPGDAGVGRPRPRGCGDRHSRRPPSGAGHRGPGGLGTRALLQWLDRLGRRPPAHRRSVTRARSAGVHVGEGVRALAHGRARRGPLG